MSENNTNNTFRVSNNIKLFMKQKGVKVKDLASAVGKSQEVVYRWLKQEVQPSISMLLRISQVLDVYFIQLIDLENFSEAERERLKLILPQ